MTDDATPLHRWFPIVVGNPNTGNFAESPVRLAPSLALRVGNEAFVLPIPR